jgi:hypothetical protein
MRELQARLNHQCKPYCPGRSRVEGDLDRRIQRLRRAARKRAVPPPTRLWLVHGAVSPPNWQTGSSRQFAIRELEQSTAKREYESKSHRRLIRVTNSSACHLLPAQGLFNRCNVFLSPRPTASCIRANIPHRRDTCRRHGRASGPRVSRCCDWKHKRRRPRAHKFPHTGSPRRPPTSRSTPAQSR